MRLRAVVWRGGRRGTAVIFPGRTEFAEKYGRVAASWWRAASRCWSIDWRGQGLSDRHPGNADARARRGLPHLPARRRGAARARRAALDLPGPRYLVAHSMGGCIGLRTLLERADFCGAVFSAPMWHLQMKAATRELTAKMTRLANLVGPRRAADAGDAAAADGDGDQLLRQRADLGRGRLRLVPRPDHRATPSWRSAGPSMQWTYAALEEMARLYVAPLPRLPMLVLLGSEETVVSPSIIRSQVAKMAEGALLDLPGRAPRDLHGAAGDPGARSGGGSTASWRRSRPGAAVPRRPGPDRSGRAAGWPPAARVRRRR